MSGKNILMTVVALGLLIPNINFAVTEEKTSPQGISEESIRKNFDEFKKKAITTVDLLGKVKKWEKDVSDAQAKESDEKKKLAKATEEAAEPAEKKLKNRKDRSAIAPSLKSAKFAADIDTDTGGFAQGCNGDISAIKTETKPSKLMEMVKQMTASLFTLSREEKAVLKIKLGQEADKEILKLKEDEAVRLGKIPEIPGTDPSDPKAIKARIEILKAKVGDLESQIVKLKIDRIAKEKKLAELSLEEDPEQDKIVAADSALREATDQQISFLTRTALLRNKEHAEGCQKNKSEVSKLGIQLVSLGMAKNDNYTSAIAPTIDAEIRKLSKACQDNKSQITAAFANVTEQIPQIDPSSAGAPVQLLINAQSTGDALVNASSTVIPTLKGSAVACNKSAKMLEFYKEAVTREGGSAGDSSGSQAQASNPSSGFGDSSRRSQNGKPPRGGQFTGSRQSDASH